MGYDEESLHLPKLMLPERSDEDQPGFRYYIEVNTQQKFRLDKQLPQGLVCWGSGHGCLLTVNSDAEILLLNPANRKVRLPRHDIGKTILNNISLCKGIIIGRSRNYAHWRVVALVLGRLFWLRPERDRTWVEADCSMNGYTDIAGNDRHLYAIKKDLRILEVWGLYVERPMWSLSIDTPIPADIFNAHPRFKSYCLDVSGDIIGVSRALQLADGNDQQENGSLLVFKIKNRCEWVEVKDLGDCCLFMGDHSSMVLSPVPPTSTFEKNCVYFTQGTSEVEIGDYSWSVYSLMDGTYRRFSFPDWVTKPPSSPLLWVTFDPIMSMLF